MFLGSHWEAEIGRKFLIVEVSSEPEYGKAYSCVGTVG
jgi:hypothetical protein